MMFHFPYFGIPYSNRYSRYGYRYPYYSYKNMRTNINSTCSTHNDSSIHNKKNNSHNNINKTYTESNKISTCVTDNINNENNTISDSPLFQLFGINLYFDDVLLICLIWFLYDEGVKDDSLFMALILLLLS